MNPILIQNTSEEDYDDDNYSDDDDLIKPGEKLESKFIGYKYRPSKIFKRDVQNPQLLIKDE